MVIRVTLQIEEDDDESRATVISSSFDNFQEIIDSKFIEKARPFSNDESDNKEDKKKNQIGFGVSGKD